MIAGRIIDVDDQDIVCPRSLPCLSTFDVAGSGINKVIEAMAGLVFFDPLDKGSAGLPYIECFTVFSRNLIYYVRLMFGRCGSFSVREYGSQGVGRLEDCSNVIPR